VARGSRVHRPARCRPNQAEVGCFWRGGCREKRRHVLARRAALWAAGTAGDRLHRLLTVSGVALLPEQKQALRRSGARPLRPRLGRARSAPGTAHNERSDRSLDGRAREPRTRLRQRGTTPQKNRLAQNRRRTNRPGKRRPDRSPRPSCSGCPARGARHRTELGAAKQTAAAAPPPREHRRRAAIESKPEQEVSDGNRSAAVTTPVTASGCGERRRRMSAATALLIQSGVIGQPADADSVEAEPRPRSPRRSAKASRAQSVRPGSPARSPAVPPARYGPARSRTLKSASFSPLRRASGRKPL
jgi:hypothetical protein